MPKEASLKVIFLAALEWIIAISLGEKWVCRTRWIKAVTGLNAATKPGTEARWFQCCHTHMNLGAHGPSSAAPEEPWIALMWVH